MARLAEEQAALRRVAMLVAGDTAPADIFAAVSAEVDRLLGLDPATHDIAIVSRLDPGPELVVVGISKRIELVPLGSHWPLDDLFAPTRVLRTGRSARVRVQDVMAATGDMAELLQQHRYLSQVSSPIVVDGRLWGTMSLTGGDDFPPDTEGRLESFTELVATAIANAESRETLARIAEEQAALRNLAILVAEELPIDRIFTAVCEQVGHLLEADMAALEIFPGDGTATLAAVWSEDDLSLPIGRQVRIEPDTIAGRILSTMAPARRDRSDDPRIRVGPFARKLSIESSLGAPILVGGRIWGALMAGSRRSDPWAKEAESRLSAYAELIATAIANAESRGTLRQLADQQAALGRVATLVAEGAAPAEVFNAVAWEVAQLFHFAAVTLSRYEDDAVVVLADPQDSGFPVGSRWPFDGDSLSVRVRATGRMARIDDYSDVEGSAGARMRERDSRSAVGVPIVVEGNLWGILCVGAAASLLLPGDIEARIAGFVELVGTAIANSQARDALHLLADEQAALRRVATLVARGAPPGRVFDAVAMEVGKLLDTDITVVGRYDDDAAATAIGSWSSSPGGVPVGTRSVVGGRNVLTLVAETERPSRVDGYDDSWGEAAEIARQHGWRAAIAAPILVEGRLWGVMLVATQRLEPFPVGAEERLAAFTDLVATALANAQANDEVRLFGEEQAALGRVAALVAAAATPEQVFNSVVEEASSLLGLKLVAFGRFDGDDTATVIAASAEYPVSPGSTWSLKDPSVIAMVARTKRAARIDDYSGLEGKTARVARSRGFRSAIGAPLTVEGRIWGAIIAYSTDPEPIPERSEARLGQFTELVATAVANAEARQALERVAAEQATLRRIATLIARGVQPEKVFAVVADETAAALDAIATVMRFEHDPPGVVVMGFSTEAGIPVGTRWDLVEGMTSAEVYRTGRSARRGADAVYWSSREGEVAQTARRLGSVSQVSCPIVVEAAVWGVIAVTAREELPPDTERRLENFTELVTTAIANADAKSELAASRRRIVAAADDARRRIERDLHDGIQQRLIALSFRARAMMRRPPHELQGIAAELSDGLKDVSDELREVSRGIHPTILTEAGLGPALRALARRSSVPIDVDVTLDQRLPAAVEAAAYYIASEALTNVAKHAQANVVMLSAAHDNGILTLEIRDDGIGGVDSRGGSGILGLTDRVEALGGTISILSPPRGGTTLSVRLPPDDVSA
jgi:GAF domain-containing protein